MGTRKSKKSNKRFIKTRSKRQRGGTNNDNLINASSEGNAEVVASLLKDGADVNAKNHLGMTALMEASRLGYEEIARELLNNTAIDVNMKDNEGWTALIWASANGHTEIVRELLVNGADVNAKSHTHISALMQASHFGHIEVVRELLENGADVNAKDNSGLTALHLASEREYIEIVELLEKAIKNDQEIRSNKQKAMELVTNRVDKIPSLETLAFRQLPTHTTTEIIKHDLLSPPRKLGGKRRTRKSKKSNKRFIKTRSKRQRGGTNNV